MLELFSVVFGNFHEEQSSCNVNDPRWKDLYSAQLSHFLECQVVDENLRLTMKRIVTPQEGNKINPKDMLRSLESQSPLYKLLSDKIQELLSVVINYVELPYFGNETIRGFLAALVLAAGRKVRYRKLHGEIVAVEQDFNIISLLN